MIIFTHIDKTSGTSFVDTVIKPNIPSDRIYRATSGKGNIAALSQNPAVIYGHTPYGLHHLTRREVDYITFLRDPIDRAVSFYYFTRESNYVAPHNSPFFRDANSVSLSEFYRNRRFQNWQTRYLAGYIPYRLYPYISTAAFEQAILKQAIQHLSHRYVCFGLLERFDDSVRLFQKTFGWENVAPVEHRMKTQNRPKVDDLDEDTRRVLREAHRLDQALYEFAQTRFETLLKG